MKKINWQLLLVVILIFLSVVFYSIHFAIYGDAQYIFNSVLARTAFVPIQVLLIALALNRLLTYHENRSRLEKINMVVGAFFTEVGTDLLYHFSSHDPQKDKLYADLKFNSDWDDAKFKNLKKRLKNYNFSVQTNEEMLIKLYDFLQKNRAFFLRMLENPNVLEHKTFSNLLLATFHLCEELRSRKNFSDLPITDHQHLAIDIKRAYKLLLDEWLLYINHLREKYPYFFSHAMRTNPFDQEASPVVVE